MGTAWWRHQRRHGNAGQNQNWPMKHEILEEFWRVREDISAECGYDLKQLAAMVRKEEGKYGDLLVSHAPRTNQAITAIPDTKLWTK